MSALYQPSQRAVREVKPRHVSTPASEPNPVEFKAFRSSDRANRHAVKMRERNARLIQFRELARQFPRTENSQRYAKRSGVMKTINTLATIALMASSVALAESGSTDTVEYELTERVNATTCQLASRWSCEGTECPTCTIDKSGFRDVMRLNFPDNKITCFEGKVRVPDNIDLVRDFNVRVTTTRIGGIGGTVTDGICTGGCAELQFLIVPVPDSEHLASYYWQIDPLTNWIRYYRSDPIPGAGANFPGKAVTAIIRDISPSIIGLRRRELAGLRLCRDGNPGLVNDTQTGVIGMDSMFIVWRTDAFPAGEIGQDR